jgi:uncharacterized protein YfiM (DUF2279 family)
MTRIGRACRMTIVLSLLTCGAAAALLAQSDPALGLRVPAMPIALAVAPAAEQWTSTVVAPAAFDTTPAKRPALDTARWCRPGAKGRRLAQSAVAATFVGGNLGLYEYFRRAWWSGEKAPFFINYDWNGPFRDQDKLGHLLGGYMLSETGRELLEAACMSERKATLWAVAYAAAFQLQIEIWDGGQARYGFSPPDMLYNTIGQGISLSHAFVPKMRAVMPTFSYSPTQAVRNVRAGLIPGDLRATVDYSGQTYWLSVDVDTLLPSRAKRYWPGLLRFSLGHTITDWVDPSTGAFIFAQRRFLLSLDLDPLKLPGNAPWWVTIKKGMRHYRFPAPALELRAGGVRGIAWHR